MSNAFIANCAMAAVTCIFVGLFTWVLGSFVYAALIFLLVRVVALDAKGIRQHMDEEEAKRSNPVSEEG